MAKSDYKFSFPFRVRYSETDAQGIVYNAHYLTYFDTAIYEYFRDLPFDFAAHAAQTGSDFHTVRAVVDFLAPSHFDDVIEVHVRAARIGRSSITFALEIFAEGDDNTLVRGEVVWVNAHQKSHKSSPLPEELIARIRDREGIAA